jgi:hypothetical protein
MTEKIITVILCVLAVLVAPLRAEMGKDMEKRAIIAQNLTLTPDQGKAFWKVYTEYENDMRAIEIREGELNTAFWLNYGTLTDEQADKLVKNYIANKMDILKVRMKYFAKLRKILPGLLVARFFQIENKLDAIIGYNLAKSVPLVE